MISVAAATAVAVSATVEMTLENNMQAQVSSSVTCASAHSTHFYPKSLLKNPFLGFFVVAAYLGAEFPYLPDGVYGVLYDDG